MIYSLNGGPVYKTAGQSAKSLSPEREKNKVFFTAEYSNGIPLVSPDEIRAMAQTSVHQAR
jgi:hypothetical protein